MQPLIPHVTFQLPSIVDPRLFPVSEIFHCYHSNGENGQYSKMIEIEGEANDWLMQIVELNRKSHY